MKNEKHKSIFCEYYVTKDFLYPSKFSAKTTDRNKAPFFLYVVRRTKKQAIEDIEGYIKKLGLVPKKKWGRR